jgi:hypothetical protein
VVIKQDKIIERLPNIVFYYDLSYHRDSNPSCSRVPNMSPTNDNFAPYGTGGRHTGRSAPDGCEGPSLKGDVFFSGDTRFASEQ